MGHSSDSNSLDSKSDSENSEGIPKIEKASAKISISTQQNLPVRKIRRRRRVKKPKVLADYKPVVKKKLTLQEKIAKRIGNKHKYEDEDILTIIPELKSKVQFNIHRKSNFSTMFTSENVCLQGTKDLLNCVSEYILTPKDSRHRERTKSLVFQSICEKLNTSLNQNVQTLTTFSRINETIRKMNTIKNSVSKAKRL